MSRMHGRQAGATLVEVLVSVVVLGLGLIGVAGLQTAALSANQLAAQYTNASTVAQNLAERMRGNRQGVISNHYNLAPGTPSAPPKNCALAGETCTAEELARWDLAVWYASLSSSSEIKHVSAGPSHDLPSAKVSVACAAPCTEDSARLITVYWDAERSGASGTACSDDADKDLRCLTLPFIP